jgi:dTDP-4-amino-4,6-dideoxygalactose transaminase
MFINEKSFRYSSELKKLIASYFCVDNVVLTSSGRNALFLVLSYLPQKKVIIPAYTCKAVTEAALLAHKEIVYVDVSPDDFNMIADEVEKIVDGDSIIIATHQYGYPCDIKKLVTIKNKNNAVLVEDCAASLGSKVDGIFTGLFGDYACFSFDSTKLVTVPSKGGFIIAKDSSQLELIDKLQDYGTPSIGHKVKHIILGLVFLILQNNFIYRIFHYCLIQKRSKYQINDDYDKVDLKLSDFYRNHMAEWQAYILIPQIKNIDKIIEKRKYICRMYKNNIVSSEDIIVPPYNSESCCIKYAIRVKNRELFYNKCLKYGIDFNFSFNYTIAPDTYINAKMISDSVINLPCYYKLFGKELKYIINIVNLVSDGLSNEKNSIT